MWGGLCGNAPSCHTAETMCLWMHGELRGGMPSRRCFAGAEHPCPEQQPRAQCLRDEEGRRWAASSMHFAPPERVTWRVHFHIVSRGEVTVELPGEP